MRTRARRDKEVTDGSTALTFEAWLASKVRVLVSTLYRCGCCCPNGHWDGVAGRHRNAGDCTDTYAGATNCIRAIRTNRLTEPAMCTPTLPETLTQLSAANQLNKILLRLCRAALVPVMYDLLVAYYHHLLPTYIALASFYEVFVWCLHLLPLASCRPGRLPLPLPPQMSSASGNERTRARTGELVILEFCSSATSSQQTRWGYATRVPKGPGGPR